jgi:dynein light chain Tctex-type 1
MPSDSVVFGHIRQESEQLIFNVCNKLFGTKEYNQTLVAMLISQTNDESVKQLLNNNKNFKYMVVTTAMQKKGSAADHLEMTADCYWNSSTDGQTCVQWENEHMFVFVTLFACAL